MKFKVELVSAKEGLEIWDPTSDMDNFDGMLSETELNDLVTDLAEEFGADAVEPLFNLHDDRLYVKEGKEILLEYKISIVDDPLKFLFNKLSKTTDELKASCIWQDEPAEESFDDFYETFIGDEDDTK